MAHDNGGRDDASEGGVGIWTYDSRGVVIQGNKSYGNRTGGPADGGGFDLDDRVSESVIQYNRSHDNDGAGYLIANPSGDPVHAGNVVRFNLSERDGGRNGYPGLSIWRRTSRLEVFHNTVVGPARAVRASELADGAAALRNNLFIRTSAGPILDVAKSASAAVFQGNAYWTSDGALTLDCPDQRYVGLSAWRAASGQERVEEAAAGLDNDPHLAGESAAGAGAGADAPAPGSPLIDAALDLKPLGIDRGGRDLLGTVLPVGSRADAGALEATTADGDPESSRLAQAPLAPPRHGVLRRRCRASRTTPHPPAVSPAPALASADPHRDLAPRHLRFA